MFSTKTIAAAKRGLEAAGFAIAGYFGATYLALDEHTGSGFIDMVENSYDKALGVGIVTLLVGFGLTRSPVKNVSPVAENAELEDL